MKFLRVELGVAEVPLGTRGHRVVCCRSHSMRARRARRFSKFSAGVRHIDKAIGMLPEAPEVDEAAEAAQARATDRGAARGADVDGAATGHQHPRHTRQIKEIDALVRRSPPAVLSDARERVKNDVAIAGVRGVRR